MEGEPEAVMDYYNALLADHQNQSVQQEVLENGKVQTVSGTGEAVVEDIALLDIHGKRIEVVDVGQSVTLRIDVRVHAFIERLVLGYGIKDRLGQVVYGTNTDLKKQPLVNVRAGSLVRFNVNFLASLGAGTYSIQTALVSTDTHLVDNYEWRDLALVFNVINISKPTFVGLAWIDPEIGIEQR
jgi:lipopolysaccharide transport system ATP-binding protein